MGSQIQELLQIVPDNTLTVNEETFGETACSTKAVISDQ